MSPINSDFHNYKSNCSIVLFVLEDADYNFTFVAIAWQRSISDGGVFKQTSLKKNWRGTIWACLKDSMLSGLNKLMRYVSECNHGFPLTNQVMKQFLGIHEKETLESTFNYRLSSERIIVENAFGILSAIIGVLRELMLLEALKRQLIVMAIACLHNFLKNNHSSRNIYTPHVPLMKKIIKAMLYLVVDNTKLF